MPTLTINGRDVDVGDEFLKLSPEQQNATVDEIAHSMGVGKSTQSDTAPSIAEGIGRAAATGVPVIGGLLNRADAATNATLAPVLNGLFSPEQQLHGDWSQRYQQALAAQSGVDQQFAQQHPVLNTGAQIAGGIASTAPLASIAIPSRLAQGPGLLSALGRAAITGTEGGIIGSADAKIRGQDPLAAAIIGSMGGAGGSLAGDALGAGWRALTTTKSDRLAQDAGRYIDKVLGKDRSAVADALANDPNATVADFSPTFTQKLRQARATPGDTQKTIDDFFANRAEGTFDRARSAIGDVSSGSESLPEYLNRIDIERKSAAQPAYDALYQQPVQMNPTLSALMSRPSMQKAIQKSEGMALEAGQAPLDWTAPGMRELDWAKRNLDQQVNKLYKGGQTTAAPLVRETRDALRDELDAQVPDYAAARSAYAGKSALMEAAENGRKFLNMNPDDLAYALKSYAGRDSEMEAFRDVGARQALMDRLWRARSDEAAGRLGAEQAGAKENIKMVFGNEEGQRLLDYISREKRYAATNKAVTGGSQTDFNMGREPGQHVNTIARILANIGDKRWGSLAVDGASGAANFLGRRRTADIDKAITDALLRNSLADVPTPPSIAPNIAALLVGSTLPAERQ